MTTPYSTAATRQDARIEPADLDRFFLDDEFDDFLDRHVARAPRVAGRLPQRLRQEASMDAITDTIPKFPRGRSS